MLYCSEHKSLYQNLGNLIQEFDKQLKKNINDLQQANHHYQKYPTENNAKIIRPFIEILELNIGIEFLSIDLAVSLRALLRSHIPYEEKFHTRNVYSIIHEGYKYLFSFGKDNKYSYWTQFGNVIKELSNESLLEKYTNITKELEEFSQQLDKKMRDKFLHYDVDMITVYKIILQSDISILATNTLAPFLNLLRKIGEYIGDVSVHIVQTTICNLQPLIEWNEVNKCDLIPYHTIVAKALNNPTISCSIEQGLKQTVPEIEMFYKTSRIVNSLSEITQDIFSAKTTKIQKLSNINVLLRIAICDLCCIWNAYINSQSEIEYKLNLRWATITKVSVLSHLIGYDDTQKEKSFINIISDLIPINDVSMQRELATVRLLGLQQMREDDQKKRNTFVHLRNNHTNNIHEQIKLLNDVDLLANTQDIISYVRLYGRINALLAKIQSKLKK